MLGVLRTLFRKYYWTHLREEETEVTEVLRLMSGTHRIQTKATPLLLYHAPSQLFGFLRSKPQTVHHQPSPG